MVATELKVDVVKMCILNDADFLSKQIIYRDFDIFLDLESNDGLLGPIFSLTLQNTCTPDACNQ